MITYSTNWMGPINSQWTKENGDNWAGGRIDIYGDGFYNGLELALPTMDLSDWGRFSEWLGKLETETLWDLTELVEEYQKTNPPIRWFRDVAK